MDSIISWVLAILQSARSYCRLLWERWLHPLHLLGPVLLGCCRLQLTSLFSLIVLQPPLLCEGWGSHPLSVWGQSSTDGSPLALWLYSSVQYSVHRFSISHSSVRHFPELSWTVIAFPCFTVVKSFTSWYALLLLFFLRFSSVSLHCSPLHFSFALYVILTNTTGCNIICFNSMQLGSYMQKNKTNRNSQWCTSFEHTHTHTRAHTYIHAHAHSRHTRIHAHTDICMHALTHICTHKHTHARVRVHAHTEKKEKKKN